MTLKVEGVGSHLSSQRWILQPFPTLQREPLLRTSRILWILCQAQEGLLPKLALSTSQQGKYFALRIQVANELGFVKILQACLSQKGKVESLQISKPQTSKRFWLTHLSPTNPGDFQLLVFCPHQKFLIILSRSSQRLFRSWKQLIVQVGMAWATSLMRVSFPPEESNFPFQPANFKPTLSLISAKTCFLDLLMMEGRPRQLVCLKSCMGPNMLRIASFSSSVVFGLK